MFHRRRSPECDLITKAQHVQITAERESRAAAREALKDVAQHLEADEAFDLLVALYAARVDPVTLHRVLQRQERAADALRHEKHMAEVVPDLARRAWE